MKARPVCGERIACVSSPDAIAVVPDGGCHVLLVDDSALQRRILAACLLRWGYSVSEAATGQEALDLCASHPPDIVLSDWMMPGMDGLELCRRFRALPRASYGYFILLTSKTEKDAVTRGLDCGADDFLTKPVNTAELRARMRAGERILTMERELTDKNRLLGQTVLQVQRLLDAIDSDLIEARKLQQSLLREKFRDFGAAQVSLLLHPAGHVGGDLVGVYPIDAGAVGIYAIDVSGHGISSALMTARLAGYLSATDPEHNIALTRSGGRVVPVPPAQVVHHLNALVLDDMQTDQYLTLLLAVVDLDSGIATICQAGHPGPRLIGADGAVRELGAGGLPVGLFPDAWFNAFAVRLQPGDRLLLMSDGVTELPDPQGVLLQDHGLDDLLQGLAALPGPQFLEALVWRLTDHAGGGDFPDDVSAVLFDYRRDGCQRDDGPAARGASP